jgi:hypothetical protein
MKRDRMLSRLSIVLSFVGAAALWDAPSARACGGCFHQPSTEIAPTVVTDHRMAFSMSPVQTVLWDQIRYSGVASAFAWVLPVKPGTRIEASHDAWIAALDANTQTVIMGPTPNCPASLAVSGGSGDGCGAHSKAAFDTPPSSSSPGPPPQVQVISESVVGPYQAVTVRSSQGEALGGWLRANGYDVPTSIQPVIDVFTGEGFDFIALKLRPGEGVQAMQPVRVVTQGADPSLPLRMVAAGVGAYVGIELWVLGEGRYHPQNFPDVAIDFRRLAWDPQANRSNYSDLARAALAAGDGTGWLTESSLPAGGDDNGSLGDAGANPSPPPPLGPTYQGLCASEPASLGDCDASASAGDAGSGCRSICDDLQVAMTGIPFGNLWVTRLRANLPSAALARDLVLEAAPSQSPVSNFHTTSIYTDPSYDPCAPTPQQTPSRSAVSCRAAQSPPSRHADAAAILAALVGVAASVRWRSRDR